MVTNVSLLPFFSDDDSAVTPVIPGMGLDTSQPSDSFSKEGKCLKKIYYSKDKDVCVCVGCVYV